MTEIKPKNFVLRGYCIDDPSCEFLYLGGEVDPKNGDTLVYLDGELGESDLIYYEHQEQYKYRNCYSVGPVQCFKKDIVKVSELLKEQWSDHIKRKLHLLIEERGELDDPLEYYSKKDLIDSTGTALAIYADKYPFISDQGITENNRRQCVDKLVS